MAVLAKGTGFEVPPRATYLLRWNEVLEERTFPNRKNPELTDVSLQVQVTVEEGEWEGTEIRFFTPGYYNDGTKTGKLFAALLGLEDGESLPDEIDYDEFEDKLFYATVFKKPNGYPDIEAPYAYRPAPKRRVKTMTRRDLDEVMATAGTEGTEPNF